MKADDAITKKKTKLKSPRSLRKIDSFSWIVFSYDYFYLYGVMYGLFEPLTSLKSTLSLSGINIGLGYTTTQLIPTLTLSTIRKSINYSMNEKG